MKSRVKRSIWTLATLVGILFVMLATLGYWLPGVINHFLPDGVSLTFANRPHWQRSGLQINSVNLQIKQCSAANAERVRIAFRAQQWQLTADKLTFDSHCFTQWPATKDTASAISLTELQNRLPKATISVADFSLNGLPIPSSKLVIQLNKYQQNLQLDNSEIQASLQLSANRLAILQVSYQNLAQLSELHLQGRLTLADSLAALPENVELAAEVKDSRLVEPLALKLNMTGQAGILKLTANNTQHDLLELPWTLTADGLVVSAGKWSWPYASQPLQGAVTFSLQDWHNLQQGPILTARANLLTSGKGGKGNLVVSAGPARLTWQDNALLLQLTGVIKALNLQI